MVVPAHCTRTMLANSLAYETYDYFILFQKPSIEIANKYGVNELLTLCH
jgi:hypothetical protein